MTKKDRPVQGGGLGPGGEVQPLCRLQDNTPPTLTSTSRYADAVTGLDRERVLLRAVITFLVAELPDARSPWLQDALDGLVGAWADVGRVSAACMAEDAEGVPI